MEDPLPLRTPIARGECVRLVIVDFDLYSLSLHNLIRLMSTTSATCGLGEETPPSYTLSLKSLTHV